jgi:uncharacterized membrane protein
VSDRPVRGRLRAVGATALAWVRRQLRAPFAASVGAVLLLWASLTPSLLPRDPVFQGAVIAVAGLLGYGLGALLGWIVRSCGGRLNGRARRRAWIVVGIAALAGTVAMVTAYLRWENQLRDVVGVDRIGLDDVLLMLLVGAGLFASLLALARGLKATGRMVGAGTSVENSSLIAMKVASTEPSSRSVATPVTST